MLCSFKKLTKSSANSKENGIVVHLLHAVVLEQDTGMGIYIRPGVLDLAGLSENSGHDHVEV